MFLSLKVFNKRSIVHSDGSTSKAALLGELEKEHAAPEEKEHAAPGDSQVSGHIVLMSLVCLQVVHLEDVSGLLLVSQFPGGGDAETAPAAFSWEVPAMVPPQDVDGEEIEEEEPFDEDEMQDVC